MRRWRQCVNMPNDQQVSVPIEKVLDIIIAKPISQSYLHSPD